MVELDALLITNDVNEKYVTIADRWLGLAKKGLMGKSEKGYKKDRFDIEEQALLALMGAGAKIIELNAHQDSSHNIIDYDMAQ